MFANLLFKLTNIVEMWDGKDPGLAGERARAAQAAIQRISDLEYLLDELHIQ